jgi:uncharacterized cupin superfamily protein
MPNSIVVAAAHATRLEHAPLPRILRGNPEARSAVLARSRDRTSTTFAWECTPGEFTWDYAQDETLVVLTGEAFVTNEAGEECRLRPGDMAFFPAGSSSRWRVTERIKKIAVVRQHLPPPVGFGVRAWHKLMQLAGWGGDRFRSQSARTRTASALIGEARGS